MDTKSCQFCEIVAGRGERAKVYEDEEHIVIMDRFPINRGHVLVIPKVHYETVFDMPLRDVSRLFTKAARIAAAVAEAMSADGMNIAQNNGRAAHQLIAHVHVHVIPRYHGDVASGWMPTRKSLTMEELVSTADLIHSKIRL